MQLNSHIFILLFLPVFVFGYFLVCKIHKTCGKTLIIIAGIVFYVYAGLDSFIILCASVLLNLLCCIFLSRANKGKRALLAAAIAMNVLLLLYYKYTDFAIVTFNGITGKEISLKEIILPLGISFFTFQQIMYIVSVYRNEVETVSIIDYLSYVFYFPKLIMGPLAEPKDLISQFNNDELKKFQWENLASGIKLFSFGLFKKMLLADTFAKAVAWGFANTDLATAGDLFLVMLFYTFEIYFDFSGYSDMAVGVSQMINITLPMNFDSPYKALSIRDFWKRWHASLTSFLTKYLYIPLGGSRKGKARTYINILIVFLVSGLWHGANWTFILWGCIHGVLQIIERVFSKTDKKGNLHTKNYAAKWVGTFLVVNLLWLLFRSESIAQWTEMLGKMFSFQNMGISDGLISIFVLPENTFLFEKLGLADLNRVIRGFPMLLFIIASFVICLVPENNYRNRNEIGIVSMVLCAMAFVWAFLCLGSESVFVYNGF